MTHRITQTHYLLKVRHMNYMWDLFWKQVVGCSMESSAQTQVRTSLTLLRMKR